MSKLSEMALAQAYTQGADAYAMRDFVNPYDEYTAYDLAMEWERGYNHARAIALSARRAEANPSR